MKHLPSIYKIFLSRASRESVRRCMCLSICNHGTAAMMAVTVLLGKTLASSRTVNSFLDIPRLKHIVILVNPRLWMVRMCEMVPAMPKQNQHLKGYWSTCKNNFIVPRYYMLRKKTNILALDNGFVTLGRTFVESPQPSSNGFMSDPIKCWIVTPSFFLRSNIREIHIWLYVKLRTNKQEISQKSDPCRENGYCTSRWFKKIIADIDA